MGMVGMVGMVGDDGQCRCGRPTLGEQRGSCGGTMRLWKQQGALPSFQRMGDSSVVAVWQEMTTTLEQLKDSNLYL